MSGALLLGGMGGTIRPFLVSRSLTSSGVWSTHHAVGLQFHKSGLLETLENGVWTPRGPEWTGQTASRFIIDKGPVQNDVWSGGNFHIRCIVLSGDVDLDAEFSQDNRWYSLTSVLGFDAEGDDAGFSGRFMSNLEPGTSATLTGVWRIQIRNGDTGVIVAQADYNVSATCTSGC